MSITHVFTQTLFFAPQDRPKEKNFDLDFSYLFNQVSPWLEKYVEGLLGIEGFKIVRGFDTNTFKTSYHAGQVFKLTIEDIEVTNAVTAFSLWIFDACDNKHELAQRKAYARPRPLWIKAPLTHQDMFRKDPVVKTHFNSLSELMTGNKKELEKTPENFEVPLVVPKFVKEPEVSQAPKEGSWLGSHGGILGRNDQRYMNIRNRLMVCRGKLTNEGLAEALGADLKTVIAVLIGDYVMVSKFLELEKKVNTYVPSIKKEERKYEAPNWHPSLKPDEPLYKELRAMINDLKVLQFKSVKEIGINPAVVSLIKTGKSVSKESAKKIYAHYKAHPEFFQEPVKVPEEEPKTEVIGTKKEEPRDLFTETFSKQAKEEVENPLEELQTSFDLISKSSAVVAELLGYPLATITGIREGTLTEMNEAHYKVLNNKVAEVLEKKAKGQLKVSTSVAVIEPVKPAVTMPKFPEAVLKTDREIREDRQKKEIFVGMAKEAKEIIATLSAYTGSSISEYLAIKTQFFGRLKAGTVSITAYPQLRSVVQKLKNVSNPDDIFVRKEDLIAKKREIFFEIKSLLSKPWGMSQTELSSLAGFAPKHILNLLSSVVFSYSLESYEELRDALKKLAEELLDNKPVKAPEMAPAPMPVKVKEKPAVVKSLSDIKKVVKPAVVENIHPSGVRIPKFDEKALQNRARETMKSYRGNSSVVSRMVHHECFMRNRQRFMIISKNPMEISKLTGIHYNTIKRAVNYNNPPSSLEQVMFFLYLNDIKSTLVEIEAFDEANA